MRVNLFQLIKFCCTRTVPAAETKSIGLQADARVVMVFASPSGQFKSNMTNPAHLSGPRHLDNFIMTTKSCLLTGTLQKRMPTLTRTATNQTAGPLVSMPLKKDNYLYHDSFLPIPGLVTNFRLKQQILLYI
jgi:hypothetical protein